MARKIINCADTLDWEGVVTHALSLEGAEQATHFGRPAVKVNGRAMLSLGREKGSFALHIDMETKQLLIDNDPRTYWETAHYQGWPMVLVRYDAPDQEHVFAMVERAWLQARALGPPGSGRTSQSPAPKRQKRHR
jgi:hypothetical protein